MKSLIRIFIIVLFFQNCISINAAADNTKKKKVLYTFAHDEAKIDRWKELAEEFGAEITYSDTLLTDEILKQYNLLITFMPKKAYEEGEKASIVKFIKNGGSLFIILDQEERQKLDITGVNDFITPFGIKYGYDTQYLHNRGALAPKSAIIDEACEIPYSGGRYVYGGTPFCFTLDTKGDITDQAQSAFVETEKGSRIIVMGEGMPSLFLGEKDAVRLSGSKPADTKYWGKDSERFNKSIFRWLIKK